MAMRTTLLSILSLLLTLPGHTQTVNTWNAYPSHSKVNQIIKDDGGLIWIATDGGLYAYQAPDSVIFSISPLDGLYAPQASAMAYDPNLNMIWLGFSDGTLQALDVESLEFRTFTDIRRADQFSTRGINDIKVDGNRILVATAFGLVIFDGNSGLVRNSYFFFGDFDAAIPVRQLSLLNGTLYLATSQGIAIGDENLSLNVPENWDTQTIRASAPSVEAIVAQGDSILALSSDSIFSFRNGAWTKATYLGNSSFSGLYVSGNTLLGQLSDGFLLWLGGKNTNISLGSNQSSTAFIDGSTFYLGSFESGVFAYDLSSNSLSEPFIPNGPALNAFTGVSASDGNLVVASSLSPGGARGFTNTGYYILKNGSWQNYDVRRTAVLQASDFRSAFVARTQSDRALLGSWGRGFAVHDLEEDTMFVFNAGNSALQGIEVNPNFIVVSGLDFDNAGNYWASTFLSAAFGLYRYNIAYATWKRWQYDSATPSGSTYDKLILDSSGQAWIVVTNGQREGIGLLVFAPNQIDDDSDDQSVYLTSSNANLPNNDVNDLVQDQRGEIWIGTSRGVARFLFPELVVIGGTQERQAQWLITENENGDRVFFLRDINATSIAVDEANQKWIGTDGSGLWHLTEEGDRAIDQFTSSNSPLISNTITDVTVDDETGTVFIATPSGLISYTGVARKDSDKLGKLFVYPNPYSNSGNSGPIYIEGLKNDALLSVMTVDGIIVDRIQTRSGRAEWTPRYPSGKQLSPGVYILAAVGSDGESRGFGKLVIKP